ncbi:VOC family protein [Rhodococcus fascians]|nr:VOC family protein [Rhodococcus fascians]MBY4140964.1 VOC family protein [Rhodococcus fascians]MBY4219628.1 VOC family protein [Rhodococcus fascians]MBY4221937.1 VOC family protein [Rhodococcus fascians]MBY4233938.1 VOC family protein [Rhodococcus fascians]
MSIGKLFHIIHMTGDLPALEAWYDDVFSVRRGFLDHNYMPGEKRDASLVLLGDSVIEPLAPAFRVEGWEGMPLGRFYNRFGSHWHSIAWYTDDAGEMWQRCTDAGVRVLVEGGILTDIRPDPKSAIMTHPKDTVTQLEFFNPYGGPMEQMDPRLNGGDFDSWWWIDNHPVKTPGLAYTTVLTRDLDRAVGVYTGVLGGELLHKSSSELTGTDDVYVRLGDTVVQLSTPNTDGTVAAADMAANGEMHHAAAFRVLDLDATEEYFVSKGIATLGRDDHTLITDPATTHGVAFRWTVTDVPGSPREGTV